MALKVTSKDGFYGWVNIAVVFLFYIAMLLLLQSFGVFLRSWINEFGWSNAGTSGAQQLGMILSGLAAPLVGRYIMKRGSKRAILLGNILSIAGLILVAYQKEMWQLYLGYGVLIGMGMSVGGMLAILTVINNWFIMKRSIAIAVSMAGMGLSGIVMTPALLKLIDTIGWRDTCLLIAAITLLFCIVVPAIFLKNRPEDLGQVPDGPVSEMSATAGPGSPVHKNLYKTPVDFTAKEALHTRTLWLIVAYVILQFLALNTMMTHHVNFLYDIGYEKIAGWAVGVFSGFMVVGQIGIGFMGLRIKMQTLATVSMGIGAAGFALLLIAEQNPGYPLIVFAYCILLGIAFGIQAIAMGNLLPDYFGIKEFPKIMGYTMPITTLVSSFGITVSGMIHDTTGAYTLAFQLCFCYMILGLICMFFSKPPIHPSLKKNPNQEAINPDTQPASPINM